jgi:hypothetical protein
MFLLGPVPKVAPEPPAPTPVPADPMGALVLKLDKLDAQDFHLALAALLPVPAADHDPHVLPPHTGDGE